MCQFRYGDDGLDPVYMQSQGKPVNIPRLYAHCLALNPHTAETGLLPYQVMAYRMPAMQ